MKLLTNLLMTCLVQYNGQDIFSRQIQFEPGIQMIAIGEARDYQLMIRDMGQEKFELQAYNVVEPSRSYATGPLDLQLAIWNREHWIQVTCSREK